MRTMSERAEQVFSTDTHDDKAFRVQEAQSMVVHTLIALDNSKYGHEGQAPREVYLIMNHRLLVRNYLDRLLTDAALPHDIIDINDIIASVISHIYGVEPEHGAYWGVDIASWTQLLTSYGAAIISSDDMPFHVSVAKTINGRLGHYGE